MRARPQGPADGPRPHGGGGVPLRFGRPSPKPRGRLKTPRMVIAIAIVGMGTLVCIHICAIAIPMPYVSAVLNILSIFNIFTDVDKYWTSFWSPIWVYMKVPDKHKLLFKTAVSSAYL